MIDPVRHPLSVKVLIALADLKGKVGNSARRKLSRRLRKRSLLDFEQRLATLGPSDVCIDLGANVGVVTEKLAATGAEVHAYEPDPYCFDLLTKRFADQENVHLHNQAVSATAGSFLLQRTRDFEKDPEFQSQSSSIIRSNEAIYDPEKSVRVEVVAFNDVIRDLHRSVALIKMDIEGSEFEILDCILADYANGFALPIGALFIETHERHMPNRVDLVKSVRKANWSGLLPYRIDTYWP